jgi:hypothetical protein
MEGLGTEQAGRDRREEASRALPARLSLNNWSPQSPGILLARPSEVPAPVTAHRGRGEHVTVSGGKVFVSG